MDLNEIVTIITNNGVAIAVVVYFLIRDYKFSTKLAEKLQELIDNVKQLTDQIRKSGGDD